MIDEQLALAALVFWVSPLVGILVDHINGILSAPQDGTHQPQPFTQYPGAKA
jgi:hypothetical protein